MNLLFFSFFFCEFFQVLEARSTTLSFHAIELAFSTTANERPNSSIQIFTAMCFKTLLASLSHRLLCEVIFGCLDHADHLPWMIVAKCLTRPCRPMAPFDTIYYLFVICLHVISFFVFVFFYALICIFCCSNASRK